MIKTHKHLPREDDLNFDDIYDEAAHAIRTTATLVGGDLAIDCLDDSIAIGDAVTGEKASVISGKLQVGSSIVDPATGNGATVTGGRLQVDTTGNVTTTFPPPTDFRVKSYIVTDTAAAVTASGFTITSVAIKALGTNSGYVRIGKSDVKTSSDAFYLLSPGESLNVPLAASTEPLYFVRDPGSPVGTYEITTIAVN